MSFEPREYLRHILAEADYLIETSRGLEPEAFENDETLRRALSRCYAERSPRSSTSVDDDLTRGALESRRTIPRPARASSRHP
jgi:hypothetical protein